MTPAGETAPTGAGTRLPRAVPLVPTLLSTLSALLAVLVVGLFLLTFVLQTYRIPSGSMEPTLQIGDFVLVTKTFALQNDGRSLLGQGEGGLLPRVPVKRGDLLVFHFPPEPSRELVKRVVALPGERVRMHEGRVFVNGRPLEEPYTLFTRSEPEIFRDEFPNLREVDPDVDPRWWRVLRRAGANGEVSVPANQYFVLGDNRNHSEDSRYWGFVPQEMVVGSPLLVYFSVPNGADAPEGGPMQRLRWLMSWERRRVGVVR